MKKPLRHKGAMNGAGKFSDSSPLLSTSESIFPNAKQMVAKVHFGEHSKALPRKKVAGGGEENFKKEESGRKNTKKNPPCTSLPYVPLTIFPDLESRLKNIKYFYDLSFIERKS